MVRSAGMHFTAEAVRFLPELEHVINFEKYAGDGHRAADPSADGANAAADGGGDSETDGGGGGVKFASETTGGAGEDGAHLSDETVRAARNLDNVIETLMKNFSEGRDYLHVLVNVFKVMSLWYHVMSWHAYLHVLVNVFNVMQW